MNWNIHERPDPLEAMQKQYNRLVAEGATECDAYRQTTQCDLHGESWPTPADVQPPATVAVVAHCHVCDAPMTRAEVEYTRYTLLCVDCMEQHHENMKEADRDQT